MNFITDNNQLKINYPDYQEKLSDIYAKLDKQDFTKAKGIGWLKLDHDVDDIIQLSKELRAKAPIMIVIGIGGSYLGCRAVESALNNDPFYQKKYQLIYAGQNTSSAYYQQIYNYVKDKDFVINVISKSGMTMEPALGFRLLKDLLISKYGEASLKERVVVTTTEDEKQSPLYQYAQMQEMRTLPIPSNVGGRYSVFTAVGLLPLAFIDVDIKQFIDGAQHSIKDNFNADIKSKAIQYAINRYEQYQDKKVIEALAVNEPNLTYFVEWYKQLFAESEGKDNKGLFPVGLINPTDLHSMEQFIQDGPKVIFETMLRFKQMKDDITLPRSNDDIDNLVESKATSLNEINDLIVEGVIKAHAKAKVPNLVIEMETQDAFNMGYLMMFMMLSCMYSGYLLGINPFDQPGVEMYKKEVKNLL